jgi:hypothetical protein
VGLPSSCAPEQLTDRDPAARPVQPRLVVRSRLPGLLPSRLRALRRPRLWEEIAFIGVSYLLYSLIRNGVPTHEVGARHRAEALYAVERAIHIDLELSINHWVASLHWLSLTANYWYAIMHFVVTAAVLGWLYLRHPLRYRSARSVLFGTNLVALVAFWGFSLAPPRLIGHGFIDTVVRDHIWGSWGTSGMDAASNQYAAMPSLHVGWALWCAIVVFTLARRRWLRLLAVAYPVITTLVILATANHFLLDAVGGAATLAFGFAFQRLLSGRPALTGHLPVPMSLSVQRRQRPSRATTW